MRRLAVLAALTFALAGCSWNGAPWITSHPEPGFCHGGCPTGTVYGGPAHVELIPPAVRFRYGPWTSGDAATITTGDRVVVQGQTPDLERAALDEIHAHGGIAFRYVQWYWTPVGRPYPGFTDTVVPPEWGTGQTDTTVHGTNTWAYMNLQNPAPRAALRAFDAELHARGWDGIFVDMGGTELRSPQAPAWVDALTEARAAGLRLAWNGGTLNALVANPNGARALTLRPVFVMDESAYAEGRLLENARLARGYASVVLIRPEVVGIPAARVAAAAITGAGLSPVRGVRLADEFR